MKALLKSFGRFCLIRPHADLILITSAIAIRLIFLAVQSQSDPLFFVRSVDEETYLRDAQAWVDAGFSREGLKLPFWQPPGYVFALGLWLGAGGSADAFIFLQLLLGAISSWLIFRIILQLFGPEAIGHGMAAAMLFNLVPSILYYETKLLKPAWVILLMLWIIYLARSRSRSGWWLLRGFLAGLTVLFDVYFIILSAALVVMSKFKREPLGGILLGLLVTVGPVAALNLTADANKGFVPVSYNGPINLFVGNNPDWQKTYNALPGEPWYRITLRYENDPRMLSGDAASTGELFLREVKNYALDEPLAFLKGLATKTLLFFSIRELPRNGAIFMNPAVIWAGRFINTAVMFIAFLCLPKLKRDPVIMLLLLMIFLVNVLFFPTTRYRLPAIPLALISIGALAGSPARWRKRTLTFVVALAAGATLLSSRIVAYDDWRAFSFNEAAWNEIHRGDTAEAKVLIDQALEASTLPLVLDTAGQIAMTGEKNPRAALDYFEQASEADPKLAQPWFNQARIMLSMNRLNEAYLLHNRYLNLIRPELPNFDDQDVRAASQALEFNARLDFEQGRYAKSRDRLIRLRDLHQTHPVDDINISGLDQQIQMLEQAMER
ncbi:MAG: glycosyltransferase family 39 protein [Kiritimatiellia bacterium]